MFHSPLGAPASYAAIELTSDTEEAILEGLRQSVPELKNNSAITDKVIEQAKFACIKKQMTEKAYTISIAVKQHQLTETDKNEVADNSVFDTTNARPLKKKKFNMN
jgi:hypothetical protein